MKGLVKVTPESMAQMLEDIKEIMSYLDISAYSETEMVWSWLKFKKIKKTYYNGAPFWYQYRESLIKHLFDLEKMCIQSLKTGDEIWISELSYCHLLKLSRGDKDANPIYIMDY